MPSWKDSVRLATTANIPNLAVVTAVDGVNLAANNRVLARVQTNAVQNGIYVATPNIVPPGTFTLNRANDMLAGPSTADMNEAMVRVSEGATFRHTQHILATIGANIGTTPLRFVAHNPTFVQVRAASTGNVTLPTPASTTIDGVALLAGDTVLLKDNTTVAENGVYLLNDAGNLERFGDPVSPDTTVRVSEGNACGRVQRVDHARKRDSIAFPHSLS